MTSLGVGQKPVATFILSLIAGVFILLGAIVMSMFTFGAASMMGSMSGMAGMMSGMYGGMSMGVMGGFVPALTALGLVSGVMVLFGSGMLYSRPSEGQRWGAIILAFSVVSILGGMGGFIVGLVLGTLGGILAITWSDTGKPARRTSRSLLRSLIPVLWLGPFLFRG